MNSIIENAELENIPGKNKSAHATTATVHPEAERAAIAGLMRTPDLGEIERLGITPDLFALDKTLEAFEAIARLLADEIQPDAATLRDALSDATLIELETTIGEHVSSANLPSHVAILKDYRQRRLVAAARDRLAQAAAAGVPEHELLAIVESIRLASAGDSRECRLTEVGSLCNLPPAESWLIKRYLPADSMTITFGSPGCGKSFLAIDLACHVATGRDWRGQPVKPGRVVYVAGEGKNGLAKRFRAWFDQHGEQPRNISLLLTPIALTDPASVAALLADIRTLPEAPALVIIDTVNRNFGPGDENSTADMTKAVAGLDAIRTATGAAILGVHHSGHVEKSRGRGSSVLFGAVDAEFAVEMVGNTVQIRATKMKDADPPPPLAWMLEKQNLPWCDDEGVPLDSAVLVPADVPACPASTGRLSAGQRIALNALRSALVEHGTEAKGVVTVAEDEWRQSAYDAGIASSDATQSARRKAFFRARLDLVSSGKVSTDDGRYWIPSPSGTRRDKTLEQAAETVASNPSTPKFLPTDSRFGGGTSGTSGTKRDNVPSCPARQDGSEAGQAGHTSIRSVPYVPPAGAPHFDELEKQESQQAEPADSALVDAKTARVWDSEHGCWTVEAAP